MSLGGNSKGSPLDSHIDASSDNNDESHRLPPNITALTIPSQKPALVTTTSAITPNNNQRNLYSTSSTFSDSAYNSLVCSPFSPLSTGNNSRSNTRTHNNTSSPINDASVNPRSHSISLSSASYLRGSLSTPDDEIFNMSLEKIDLPTNTSCTTASLSSCVDSMAKQQRPTSVMFIPINQEYTHEQMEEEDDGTDDIDDATPCRHCDCNTSHRTISTQTTSFVLCPFIGRPNSAPLHHYIEEVDEELDEINGAGSSGHYEEQESVAMHYSHSSALSTSIPRNSTYTCIRSPMPDVIPTPNYIRGEPRSQIASRLSYIADEIDNQVIRNQSVNDLNRPRSVRLRNSESVSYPPTFLDNQNLSLSSSSSVISYSQQSTLSRSIGRNRLSTASISRSRRRSRRLSTSAITEMSPSGGSFLNFIYSLYDALKRSSNENSD